MWGCRPGSWPDPRYDWPGCLWADLSATDLGRCVLPPVRWACPDRGLAATRHHHSPDRPAGPTTAATRPEPIRRQAHDQHAASRPVQPGRCRRHRGDLGGRYHKDTHLAAVLNSVGALLDSRCLAATAAGYQQLLGWAQAFGTPRRAGVECTGSYGAALSRHLPAAGVQVLDVNQPDKATRRRRGKTDAIDAEAAARAVLAGRATATAKTGAGPVEGLGCSSSPRTLPASPAPRRSTS
jgi:Transposase